MFVDSHCHLNFPELNDNLERILVQMKSNQVIAAICISVNMQDFPQVLKLAENNSQLWASVGVHPDCEDQEEASVDYLCQQAQHPKVVGIGEVGLDYYRLSEPLEWQRDRFRTHIRAAISSGLPLIIHTRQAKEDTLRIMREEGAERCGGVMHCFTEDWKCAQQALDLGFYLSMSGIVTFKNALQVQEVATKVPLDRLLIETDSPYLAPVPYRGKLNDPSKVIHVAEKIAELRHETLQTIGEQTTNNFFRLFNKVKRDA